jgi:TRAP-type C4-dicarboxylate transport system permease small subunit
MTTMMHPTRTSTAPYAGMKNAAICLRIIAALFAIASIGGTILATMQRPVETSNQGYEELAYNQNHPNERGWERQPTMIDVKWIETQHTWASEDANHRWWMGFAVTLFFASFLFTGLQALIDKQTMVFELLNERQ